MLGKKGQMSFTQLIVLIVVISGIFLAMYGIMSRQFAAVPAAKIGEIPTTVAKGGSASLSVAVYDAQADTRTQVSTKLYGWLKDGTSITGSSGVVTNATSRTELQNVVNVKDEVTLIAFDSTYPYGEEKTITIETENQVVDLNTNKGANVSNLQVIFFDRYGNNVTSLNVGPTEIATLNNINLRVGEPHAMFNLGMVCVDLPENSNITTVNFPELEKVNRPDRLKNVDFCFKKEAKLKGYEDVDLGTMEIQASSNDPSETIKIYFIDKAPFIGVDGSLKYGVETDELSPSDVGLSDAIATLTIN